MSDILQKDRHSITAAIYHLKMAAEYLGTFQMDCVPQVKKLASMWGKKTDWILNDIFTSLDERSRIVFRQEIQKGDPVFVGAMAIHLLSMTAEQRELIEKVAAAVAAGEEVEFVKSENQLP